MSHSMNYTMEYPQSDIDAGDFINIDMPSEAVSHIDLIFRGETDDTTADYLDWPSVLADIDEVSVEYNGKEIFGLSGAELYMYANFLTGFEAGISHPVNDADGVFYAVLRIPFSRTPFDPTCAFPATLKGASNLLIQFADSISFLDDVNISVGMGRLPGASPNHFLAHTRQLQTISGTGNYDLPIQTGYDFEGFIFKAGEIYNKTAETCSLDNLEFWLDSDQILLHGVPFAQLRNMTGYNSSSKAAIWQHVHEVTTAGDAASLISSPQQYGHTSGSEYYSDFQHYAFLDLNPGNDGKHILSVPKASDFLLRYTAAVTGTNVVLPVLRRSIEGMTSRR